MITKIIALDWRCTMKDYQIKILSLLINTFIIGWSNSLLIIPCCAIVSLGYCAEHFVHEEKLFLTLPVKRNTIVAGRFALSLIILLCSMIMGVSISLIANQYSLMQWFIGFRGYLVIISLAFLLYALFNLFMFPILFALGYQKGKIWGSFIPGVFFVILIVLFHIISHLPKYKTHIIDFIIYASDNIVLVGGGLIVLAVILIMLSYMASIKLYSKRDF